MSADPSFGLSRLVLDEDQFQILANWIEREARYAAEEMMGRNDCAEANSRQAYRDTAKAALVRKNTNDR